jgi:hypothetical protein
MMARFDGNLVVTGQDLQNYGLSLIQKEDPSFKASSGWALRSVGMSLTCETNFLAMRVDHKKYPIYI